MANNLNVPHCRQAADGFCLPACAQMVLAYLGVSRSQESLARQLGVRRNLGVPHRAIVRLQSAEITVCYQAEGTLATLQRYLEQGLPIIAFVQISELPHWRGHIARHALVVVGLDAVSVVVLDPAATSVPLSVPRADFQLAWDEVDCTYAVLNRQRALATH